jgi:hypothetical protein
MKLKDINLQVLIKAIHYVLNSIKLLILFGIRKDCHNNGRNVFLYLFIEGL